MDPYITNDVNGVLFESDAVTDDLALATPSIQKADNRKIELVWRNIIFMSLVHPMGIYGGYLSIYSAKWQTNVFAYIVYVFAFLGITAGAHRLWAHKAYKAKWPLRLMLTVFNTFAMQDSVINWVRDHRMHHKYSETDADPHNATRGFFFSHIGWLFVRKHPELKRKGKGLDLDDLYADPILRFQNKYYMKLITFTFFVFPTVIPVYFWNETWSNAFYVCAALRYAISLNATWLVNSAAHKWGTKPYDKAIKPTENIIFSIIAFGEAFHNYHHTFPWDYRTSELGHNMFNVSTVFINLCAKIGWAYDMKIVSNDVIQKRIQRTGDGTLLCMDKQEEEKDSAIRINPKEKRIKGKIICFI